MTKTSAPDYDDLSAWPAAAWEMYARTFLAARGLLDPAGGIWLANVLMQLAPAVENLDPGDREAPRIQREVARHFARIGICKDPDEYSHPSTVPVVFPEDVQGDGTRGPIWLKTLSLLVWVYGSPYSRERIQYPAIPEVIVEPLAAILGGRAVVGDDGQVRVNRESVGTFTPARARAEALGSVAAHRVLRFVVGRAWVRAVDGIEPSDEIAVSGGWKNLAKWLGLDSRSGAQDVQRAGEALAGLRLATPLGNEKILTLHEARRDRVTTLTLVAEGPLAVGYTGRLRKAKKPDRLLVPLRPDVPALTPQRSSHAQQLSFEMMLLREFRCRLRDTATQPVLRLGHWKPKVCASIPDTVIDAAARHAGLSRKNLDAVLDVWRRHGDEGGWIARASPGAAAYVLHGTSAFMESFMLAGFRMQLRGQLLGARSARSRASKRPAKQHP